MNSSRSHAGTDHDRLLPGDVSDAGQSNYDAMSSATPVGDGTDGTDADERKSDADTESVTIESPTNSKILGKKCLVT